MKLAFMMICFLCCANFWWSCFSRALPAQSSASDETWTLLTDPQILAAIIGFIGTVIGGVITTYPCCGVNNCCPSAGAWLKNNLKVLLAILLACCSLFVLLSWLGSPFLSSSIASQRSNIITSYAQYLMSCYQKPLPDDEKLLRNIGKIYIELAVIRNENISREESNDLLKMNIRGQTDKVLLKRPSIALKDILKPGEDGKPIQSVLVEGAPGAGKSRLAWELCRKWAQVKLDSVKHYKLVVLVQLRGKRAQEAKIIHDLFPLSKNNNIEQVIDAIGNGDGVLIILEGFDELPDEQRKKGSVYIDLIEREELLPEATVIITSRPSVSAYLMKYPVDRRLEILGFTEAKIEDYARSVNFSNSKMRNYFLEYINGNPFIKGMMYLPLNAVFVASIFEAHHRTDLPYPKTMTQLYDAVTRSLIRRHLVDKKLVPPEYTMPIQSLQCMEDIKRLPPPVPNLLLQLARIAYEGLLNEQFVFTYPGFWNESYDHLGMMKKTVSLDDPAIGSTFTFTFLHLTLQEYLSALHMSLVLSSTQLYDALVRRLIRSHIIYEKLEPADYHMPQTLQSKEYINSLPRIVADQLLLLAQIAYEGVHENKYEFTDLANGSEFIHFGMMKKIRLNNPSTSTDPTFTTGLVFIHHTLQEYLSALYKSLTNEGHSDIPDALCWHSDLGLPLPPNSEDILSRFLAGLCKHSNSTSFSCKLVGEYIYLAFTFDRNNLKILRSAYESDSIVQESQKLQEIFSESRTTVWYSSSFDYYLVGHCICHHSGMWNIFSYKEESIKCLVQGLKSCDDIPKGKQLKLLISKVDLLELDPLSVSDLQELTLLRVTLTASNVNIIRKHISPGGALRKIHVCECAQIERLFPIVFESSFLDEVHINNKDISLHINDDALNLMMNNSNLKELKLIFPLKLPVHTVCHNASSDYLAKLLLVFISSKHTFPKIEISHESSKFDVFFGFVKTSAGNREPEAKLTITICNSCYYDVTQQILARIPEQYHIPVHIVAYPQQHGTCMAIYFNEIN